MLSEGRGDAYFIQALAELLVGEPFEPVQRYSSWPRLQGLIRPVLFEAYHNQSQLAIVCFDTDDSPWDCESHRFRRQLDVDELIQSTLADLPEDSQLQASAVAAAPCREAWLEFLLGGDFSEEHWRQIQGQRHGGQVRRELKYHVYQNDRFDWWDEREAIDRALRELPGKLEAFRRRFPDGLRSLFESLGSSEV